MSVPSESWRGALQELALVLVAMDLARILAMMQIVMFTSGRAGKSLTPDRLPPSIAGQLWTLVPYGQGKAYNDAGHGNVQETPEGVTGIAKRRQWCLEQLATTDKVVMLDDDLRFDTRRTDDLSKFIVSTPQEVEELFVDIDNQLNKYKHLGVMTREGGNFHGEAGQYIEVGRATRVHGLRVQDVRALGCRFDRLPLMEDMDMTLQLLRLGHPNVIVNYMVQGQGMSNAPGGCSVYRTPDLQAQAANGLAELHRPHVKTVEREVKSNWGEGFNKRLDVQVQWQKAYEEGKRRASGVEQKELL